MMDNGGNSLKNARILLVEDEYWVANDLAESLKAAGVQVIGPVGTLADAERLVENGAVDGAVLDMNLHGNTAFQLVDRLRQRGVPIVITTGYGADALPASLADVPRLQKPFDPSQLLKLLPDVVAEGGRTRS